MPPDNPPANTGKMPSDILKAIMVLAGFIVALGSVVDDAIIDVENIVRRLREHRRSGSTRSTARIILDASLEVRPAILQATVIIVLAGRNSQGMPSLLVATNWIRTSRLWSTPV